jgi:branched-subunit amino acid ABC-type transport system permease component
MKSFHITIIGSALIGVITTSYDYGWFINGQFNKTGAFLNLFLVTLWCCIVHIIAEDN